LWLLHEENKWNEVGEILDFSYFVSIDKEKAGGGTIKRHILGGRDVLDATNYYKEVDSKNFDLIIKNKDKAEKIIPTYCDL
jgi:pantothenate kinase